MPIVLSFSQLWQAYPKERHPCDDPWSNQCAIRMSISLIGAGFPLTNYTDPLCSHKHARGAESLANYLWRTYQAPVKSKKKENVKPYQGIIFFKNIMSRELDHIDLWDKGTTKTGEYFASCQEVWFWKL